VTALDFEWIPLGSLLVGAGLVTQEQLDQALVLKEARAARLGEVIVEAGYASTHEIAAAVAEQYGLEFVSLTALDPAPEAVARFPEHLARRYEALPVRVELDGTLVLAFTDPTNLHVADDVRIVLGEPFRIAVADPAEFDEALGRAYRRGVQLVELEPLVAVDDVVDDIREIASSKPTINLVNSILSSAMELGASDVHVEPRREDLLVRTRVDGVMRELAVIPRHMKAAVVSRLKIMGGLDISERRLPQDGRASVRFGGDPLDLRVAVLPTRHGEQVVIRLLNGAARRPRFQDLSMSRDAEQAFLQAIRQPYGGVVVCGPTGSGKTTTLYAALDVLNDDERVMMTIEDPIEYELEGVNQVEVDEKAGLTFARGLRTILRSDPDVLLIGEVRDEETAATATRAAMTGHLVLTSLHAHNAAAAIVRLRDMGVEAGLLASSLNCIVAQRLARRLCLSCREPYRSVADEVLPGLGANEVTLYRSRGCSRCAFTGHAGRVALHEVMPIRGDIRSLVEASAEAIFAAAVAQGMSTLRADGVRQCLEGVCSLEEVARVTGDRLL
jgi:type IV pilus assembly protein PilB